jgi:hypothetical protein
MTCANSVVFFGTYSAQKGTYPEILEKTSDKTEMNREKGLSIG